ncbi:major facilitator transporter [Caballeronia arvi]|uniref:Major facilitator transporter n=1 Tax=Caballeronia arvi TaxID=1777135 RepID=A0A158J6G5_9BURK|nr:MFS transporter [Caballeronia arvi]SAL63911.1 major facilitator transporter [Caballeronia arvi]
MEINVRRTVDERPMSRFQVTAVVVCIVLNMLDGFDVLAVAFSAAHLSADWKLTGKEIGVLLSAGLFGMAGGSMFIAPLADRVGRRPLVIGCLATIACGMMASAFAQNLTQLVALRAATGLGIGGMLASTAVIASEYSSLRWRSGAVSMQSTGYALGATLGGAASAYLLMHFGWRSVFVFGGLATAIVLPLVLSSLPESLDFLIARRPAFALDKVNNILERMGVERISALPKTEPTIGREQSSASPLSHGTMGQTLCIWAAFFCVMAGFYFVMSWTPKLLVQAGLSAVQGITGGVLLNVGGMVGCTLFSFASARCNVVRLLAGFLVASALLIGMFGAVSSSLSVALIVSVILGAVISACVGGLYALTPRLYAPQVRATGVGWAIGMGRAGAILAPFAVGALLDSGWSVSGLYYLFCGPFILAVLFVVSISLKTSVPALPEGQQALH